MSRKPRFYLPNVPVHAVQRGNNCQAIFFNEADYKVYLDWLKVAANKYSCQIHAYVLMTNHVHLLITPNSRDGLSRLFQYIGRYYVSYINKTYGRTGTLWEGRYKANMVEQECYLLNCYRYIELNPVRAGMVNRPEDYIWSSYKVNALEGGSSLLSPHQLYLQLGKEDADRKTAYKRLFKASFDMGVIDDLRASLQSGTPLGGDRFKDQIEQVLKVSVGQVKRGRPRKIICKKS